MALISVISVVFLWSVKYKFLQSRIESSGSSGLPEWNIYCLDFVIADYKIWWLIHFSICFLYAGHETNFSRKISWSEMLLSVNRIVLLSSIILPQYFQMLWVNCHLDIKVLLFFMDALLKCQLPTIESYGVLLFKKNQNTPSHTHIYRYVFTVHFLYWKVLKSSVRHEIPLD